MFYRLSTHKINPHMAFALVLYRDHPPQDDTFVTLCHPLFENLEIQQALDQARASGGGDQPEAVVDGLYDALYKIEWRQGAHKIIFLVGDAPPHGIGVVGDGFPTGCPCGYNPLTVAHEAREKGISIFALGVGNDYRMQHSFAQISGVGGGIYVPIDSAGVLIDRVLKITLAEFDKVDIDRVVYHTYYPKITAEEITKSTNLDMKEVRESIIRLRKKEML